MLQVRAADATRRLDQAATNEAVASAINPVGGKDALLCTEGQTIFQVKGLRTTPHLKGAGIDASGYTGEGGSSYDFF